MVIAYILERMPERTDAEIASLAEGSGVLIGSECGVNDDTEITSYLLQKLVRNVDEW